MKTYQDDDGDFVVEIDGIQHYYAEKYVPILVDEITKLHEWIGINPPNGPKSGLLGENDALKAEIIKMTDSYNRTMYENAALQEKLDACTTPTGDTNWYHAYEQLREKLATANKLWFKLFSPDNATRDGVNRAIFKRMDAVLMGGST